MTIWIVNPFDNLPPEGLRAQRYWLMARAFVRAGWQVVYFSADFSHAFKRKRRTPDGRPVASGLYDGIRLELVSEPAYPKNICLRRLYCHWRFARNWLGRVARLSTPDLVVASSPPLSVAAAARKFCRRTGAKLVVDVQDAWPETFARVVPSILLAPLKCLARRNYLAADAITAVSRRYLDLVRGYGATCPTHLCYHGIDRGGTTTTSVLQQGVPPPSHPLALVYVGNMSLSYDLATVIDAVKGSPGLTLDLAGKGPDEAVLRARTAGCDRIRFRGYLDETALRTLLAAADVGVIPMFDASQVGIPGKLADYAAAGLPIVNSLTGETAELLAKHRRGAAYVAGNKVSFLSAAMAAATLGKATDDAFLVEFDAQKLYNGYISFVEELFVHT